MSTGNMGSLAKLTVPKLPKVVERTRLFEVLDHTRQKPFVWITAPAGMGKTTLVASYLRARQLKPFWYQIDERDADPATLFHYLRLGAQKAAPRYRRPLPHLSPEYFPSLPIFTRRFFKQLYGRMSPTTVFVFDNYQELPPGAPTQALFELACTLVPQGLSIMIVSRDSPPAPFSEFRHNQWAHIEPEFLRLTPQETEEIMALHSHMKHGSPSQGFIADVQQKTDGWVAGLVLYLEQVQPGRASLASQPTQTPQVVFDYMALEVFKNLDSESQGFLLQTALLPGMTVKMAERVTAGAPTAKSILESLYQRRYFTERRNLPEVSYQFHPLFREFLQNQLRETGNPGDLAQLQIRSARVLEEVGRIEEAMHLLQEAGDLPDQIRLIETHAPVLLTQGRMQTLEGWLRALPNETLEGNPWILYWFAQCRMVINPNEAVKIFERVNNRFLKNAQDPKGIFLSWCGVVDSIIYSFEDYGRLGPWIDQLISLQAGNLQFPSLELEAQVTFTMFGAMLWARMGDHRIFEWEARVRSLLGQVPDISQRILVGFHLHHFWTWLGNMEKADEIYLELKQWKSLGGLSPLARVFLYHLEATDSWLRGKGKACLVSFTKGEKLVKEYGLSLVAMTLHAQGITGAIMTNNISKAKALLEEIRPLSEAAPGHRGSQYYHMASWLAFLNRDLAKAQSFAERALHDIQSSHNQFLEGAIRYSLAQIFIQKIEWDRAERQLNHIHNINQILQSRVLHNWISQVKVQLADVQGQRDEKLTAIKEVLVSSRQSGIVIPIGWQPTLVARMCASALEAGIEVRQARQLIKSLCLVPVDPLMTSETWPWPVKIYTLGQVKLYCGNTVVKLGKKGQSRPLILLKALIVLGGINVSHDNVCDLLWPKLEADAAHRALATTIHRLRELLRDPQALLRQERKLSLNSAVCWVDALSFEALLKGTPERENSVLAERDRGDRDRAINLYTGPFLKEEEEFWITAFREKLRGQYVRQVGYRAADWEANGQGRRAVQLLQEAIKKEPFVEVLYQQLMTHLLRLGDKSSVPLVYEECRKALKTGRGVDPSSKTIKLAESLK